MAESPLIGEYGRSHARRCELGLIGLQFSGSPGKLGVLCSLPIARSQVLRCVSTRVFDVPWSFDGFQGRHVRFRHSGPVH